METSPGGRDWRKPSTAGWRKRAVRRQARRVRTKRGSRGTGFWDASVLHGPTDCLTMDRRTLTCFPAKSTSPHFRPNNSLMRSPVPAAKRTRVPLSVTQTVSESIDFGRQKHFWYCASFRALADEGDGIVVGEFVSSRVVKEHAHQDSNLSSSRSGEWKGPAPQFDIQCPDSAKIGRSPISARSTFSDSPRMSILVDKVFHSLSAASSLCRKCSIGLRESQRL